MMVVDGRKEGWGQTVGLLIHLLPWQGMVGAKGCGFLERRRRTNRKKDKKEEEKEEGATQREERKKERKEDRRKRSV